MSSLTFKTPGSIETVVNQMWLTDQPRARNRARIDRLFNGEQPYTQAEATKNKVGTNVNFLEATNIAHGARGMFAKAFTDLDEYFTVVVEYGPVHKRQEWSAAIQKWINNYLNRSFEYAECQDQKFASVVLHGVGPAVWDREDSIIPTFVSMADFLFPSRTTRDMTNLEFFCIHREWTPAQLFSMADADQTGNVGWNKPMIARLINEKYKEQIEAASMDNWQWPEALAEDMKSNVGYYSSDAVPKIRCWDFFYYNADKQQWNRRIILKSDAPKTGTESEEGGFLFDSKDRGYGKRWQDLFTMQYADGNNVPPFRYHSIRSLGFLLYATANLANRLRCKKFDAAFRETLTLFRNVGDGDRERLELIELQDHGVIPEGLNMVTAAERYQVNVQLLQAAQADARQIMAENSAHYTNDASDGNSSKDKTATQIIAESQAANALVGAMLGRAYRYEEHQDREICRRLCVSKNPDAVRFRQTMLFMGVPPEVLNVELWNIHRTKQIGNGNKVMQMAMADRLMAIRPQLDPAAQRDVDRIYVQATTDDQDVANLLVPMDEEKTPSPTQQVASLAWGTLIDSKPVVLNRTLNRVEYINFLLQFLNLEFQQIQQSGELPDIRRVMGIANVIDHLQQQVATLEGDPGERERVKVYSDVLAQATNQVEKLANEVNQKATDEGKNGLPPETQAKIQAMLITAQSKAKIAEANQAQKRQHKEIAFQQDQVRKQEMLKGELAANDSRTAAQILRDNMANALTPPKSDE